MAGRGRGRGVFKSSPGGDLRRPGETLNEPVAAPSVDEFQECLKKIGTISTESDVNVLATKLTTYFSSGKGECSQFTSLAQVIYDRCLTDFEFIDNGVSLFNLLVPLELNNEKFRNSVLRLIQGDYKNSKKMKSESSVKFICYVTTLSQIFRTFQIGGQPLKPLSKAVCDCLELLIDGGHDEIEAFYSQLLDVGHILKESDGPRLELLFTKIRTKAMRNKTLSRTRCLFLELIERHARGWASLSTDLSRFYSDMSMDLDTTDG